MLNANLPPILHRFRDIAFDKSKIAIFGYPLVFNSPDDLRNFLWMSKDGQGTKYCRNIAENFNRLSRAHERYRQTDDRRTGDSI